VARKWLKALPDHRFAETHAEDLSVFDIKKTSSIARRGFSFVFETEG
jgi:hypothetical protein